MAYSTSIAIVFSCSVRLLLILINCGSAIRPPGPPKPKLINLYWPMCCNGHCNEACKFSTFFFSAPNGTAVSANNHTEYKVETARHSPAQQATRNEATLLTARRPSEHSIKRQPSGPVVSGARSLDGLCGDRVKAAVGGEKWRTYQNLQLSHVTAIPCMLSLRSSPLWLCCLQHQLADHCERERRGHRSACAHRPHAQRIRHAAVTPSQTCD
eukprot:scaffold87429_cov35-Tisochrysis_lutea.AAC.1